MIITNVFEKIIWKYCKKFLKKSIWRVHLSNLWCTFAQAIFVFWVYRSRWVDCFGCSMVRFVDSMPSYHTFGITIFAFLIAQNCELSARRNLWVEILEFWACSVILFIYSVLCWMWVEMRNFYKHKSSPFRCKRTPFALRLYLFCNAKRASLHTWSCTLGVQRSPFGIWMGRVTLQKR